jgi:hypothetical protein
MTLLAQTDHRPVQRLESGKQGGGAVAFLVMGHGAGPARFPWQSRLGAVQRLNLALFIAAQHQSMLGRIQIQPNGGFQLLGELRVLAQLEALQTVRLQAVGTPDAPHTGFADAHRRCQFPRGPVRGVGRLLLGVI